MKPLETKIRHALAVIHAAIENPTEYPLREANARAADLLDDLDPWALLPAQRSDVAAVTVALRDLRRVLSSVRGGTDRFGRSYG
jgi:hypothetical protein